MSAQDDEIGAMVLVFGLPFLLLAGVSRQFGTCSNLIRQGFEGIFIVAQFSTLAVALGGIGSVILMGKTPTLWKSWSGIITKVAFGIGIVWLATALFSAMFDPPACATLPAEQFQSWLGSLVPW